MPYRLQIENAGQQFCGWLQHNGLDLRHLVRDSRLMNAASIDFVQLLFDRRSTYADAVHVFSWAHTQLLRTACVLRACEQRRVRR